MPGQSDSIHRLDSLANDSHQCPNYVFYGKPMLVQQMTAIISSIMFLMASQCQFNQWQPALAQSYFYNHHWPNKFILGSICNIYYVMGHNAHTVLFAPTVCRPFIPTCAIL